MQSKFSAILIIAILALMVSQSLDKRALRTKFCLSALLLLMPATWLFLDSLSGNGLNYATVYHIRTGLAGAGIADFKSQIAHFVGSIALIILVSIGASWAALKFRRRSTSAQLAYFTSALAILALNPLSQDILRLANLSSGDSSMVSREYIKPSAGSSFRKKNIVVIYAESLERTYFQEKAFPNLTPNLQRLSMEGLDYTDVRAARGTGWTIAGIVASMCGVPLTVWRQEDGNQLGRIDRFLPGASCLSDWLASTGYKLEFIGGADSEFAGKAKFLAGHGFDTIRDSNYFKQMDLPPEAFSSWGVHDDILLEHAATRFDQLSAQQTPFLLSVLTLDTHHPSGHVPAACGDMKYTGLDQAYPILDAVTCSDVLISRFVDRIRSGPYASNTTIVLASDHLGMPNDARDIINSMNDERRNMLLVFDSSINPKKIDVPATTIDTGAILLSVLGGNTSLGFGRVPRPDVEDGLSKAMVSGRDTSAYDSYAQSLWQLGDSSRIRLLADGQLQIGSQQIPPPLSITIDDDGVAQELSLGADYKQFADISDNWIHINRCAAFKADDPANWCALESKAGGEQYLYSQSDLLNGLDLGTSPPEDKRVHLTIGSNYIVRTKFEDNFSQLLAATAKDGSAFSNLEGGVLFNGPFAPMPAGDYHVSIKGRASGAKAAWADVIAASGKMVLARGPLRSADDESYEIYSADIRLENDAKDIEVRVYAGKGEAVRVDSFTLNPRS